MKIYIAGKITGDRYCKRKFLKIEKKLKRMGHSPMNPSWINASQEFDWQDYMAVAKAMQKRCDATLLLTDWKESRGAQIEYENAKKMNHAVFFSIKDIPVIK